MALEADSSGFQVLSLSKHVLFVCLFWFNRLLNLLEGLSNSSSAYFRELLFRGNNDSLKTKQ